MAVHLDAATRAAVVRAAAALRESAGPLPVSWVSPDNVHVTVKFLGGIAEARIPPLVTALQAAMTTVAPFALELGGLGAFPSVTRPRVLWAGISRGGSNLMALAGRVDDALAAEGVARESREFSPHVTIGRVRELRRIPDLTHALGVATQPFGGVAVASIALMRSDLSPRGARYTPLAVVPFGG